MKRYGFLSAALAALTALPVTAQVPDDVIEVGLLSGWREADGRHVAGLSIRLAPGWKTYWRAPGDGGIPPVFNWSGSSNISGLDVHFPVPQVFQQNGLRSIGYKEAVIFPLLIETKDPNAPISLRGEVELGVCEDICIPVSFELKADLVPTRQATPALQSALADRPMAGAAIRCDIEPIADGLRVGVETETDALGPSEFAVVEAGEAGLWVSEAATTRDGGTLRAEVEMVPPNAKPFALSRADVRLTILWDGQAVESEGCD